MGRVRPFVEADVPQVARVHQRAFKLGESDALDSYHDYFASVFLDNPAGDGPLPSLVYEDDDGRILGFVGLVPRRVTVGGRRYQAVVSSQFIVDPSSRAGLVAVRLARAYLEGPQDLSIADEANDVSRTIWEGLGGTTALLFSIHWTRPLRPARLAISYLRQRPGLAGLAAAAGPVARIVDLVATRARGSQFRQSEPLRPADDLWAPTALAQAPELCGDASLRVEYDAPTFQWLLDRAARMNPQGRLLKGVLRKGGRIAGWYVCHLVRGAVAEVLQITAAPSSIHELLDHLFYRAWREGAVAVTGRLEPRFMQALSDKHCLFHRRGPWMLLKTDAPQLREAFQTGDACFSRLDGEWSLRFVAAGGGRRGCP